jgi:uracil-DNA glycosylase
MNIEIEKSWKKKLKNEFDKQYFISLIDFLNSEVVSQNIFPPRKLIFNAFNSCAFDDVKVVILGQDPYHRVGQAHGLSFSVPSNVPKPPSLKNIFKELSSDLGVLIPQSGNLIRWANQGVLLLNSILTVREGVPGSHKGRGWEIFTDNVIKKIANEKENIVFMLWGAYAQKKCISVSKKKHLVIKTPHPSPFSAYRGFFESKQFTACNKYLLAHEKQPINW